MKGAILLESLDLALLSVPLANARLTTEIMIFVRSVYIKTLSVSSGLPATALLIPATLLFLEIEIVVGRLPAPIPIRMEFAPRVSS